ncbi:OPT superfamily oligopeptide transporter [Ramicandelaber brevisporus]|nr:OPT superfamily oligopeptide transporter [Ramicandelaber brevisporus]
MDYSGKVEQNAEPDLFDLEDDDNNSPYIEVRIAVPNTDDPSIPVVTFRSVVLGLLFVITQSGLNLFNSMRTAPQHFVGTMIILLVSYPIGRILAFVLPKHKFRTFGYEWTLNPGPFSIKEHALITIFVRTSFNESYIFNYIINRNVYSGLPELHPGISWLLLVCAMTLSLGLCGICYETLIRPASMIWPISLSEVVIFRSLHSEVTSSKKLSRFQMLMLVSGLGIVWHMVPKYFMTLLMLFPLLCAFDRDSLLYSNLSDLGILNFTASWSVVSPPFLLSPVYTPLYICVQIFAGWAFVSWIIIPIAYYGTNTWETQNIRYVWDMNLYNSTWQPYTKNDDDWRNNVPPRLAFSNAFFYACSFALATSTFVYVGLNYGKEFYLRLRHTHPNDDDIHARLMEKYPKIPQWWFMCLFAVMGAIGIILSASKSIDVEWHMFVLVLAIACLAVLPFGTIVAITNQRIPLDVLSEMIYGAVKPHDTLGNIFFKTFATTCELENAIYLYCFKLGHYLKIPPRATFFALLIGTILSVTSQLAIHLLINHLVPDVCSLGKESGWDCHVAELINAYGALFGHFGPTDAFARTRYAPILHGFWIGALLPIPVYFLTRPGGWLHGTIFDRVSVPMLLYASMAVFSIPNASFVWWFVACLFFNGYLLRYKKVWWAQYALVMSSGLDISVVIVAFLVSFLPPIKWAMNDPYYCRA